MPRERVLQVGLHGCQCLRVDGPTGRLPRFDRTELGAGDTLPCRKPKRQLRLGRGAGEIPCHDAVPDIKPGLAHAGPAAIPGHVGEARAARDELPVAGLAEREVKERGRRICGGKVRAFGPLKHRLHQSSQMIPNRVSLPDRS